MAKDKKKQEKDVEKQDLSCSMELFHELLKIQKDSTISTGKLIAEMRAMNEHIDNLGIIKTLVRIIIIQTVGILALVGVKLGAIEYIMKFF